MYRTGAFIALTGVIMMISMCPASGETGSKLFKYLFNTTRYDKRLRPLFGSSQPVNVTVGLSLNQIENLDEKLQLLTSHVVITMEWTDLKLSWNPSNYAGVEFLIIPCDSIWFPDIVVYNSIHIDFTKSILRSNALLHNDGLVVVKFPKVIYSSCKTNVANYPFDKQQCALQFGSWSYNGFDLAVQSKGQDGVDLSGYVKNGQWKLDHFKSEQHKVVYGCCPEPYYDITYYIQIRRQVLYYAMYFIIPCVLIALLAATIFILPQDCSERITVGMCSLVGLSFFFLLVSENMPPSSTVPLIGGYYSVTMIQMGFSFYMNIIVLRFHNMTDENVPEWVRKFILGYGARFLRKTFISKPELTVDDEDATSGNTRTNHELGDGTIVTNRVLRKKHAMEVVNADNMIVTAFKSDSESSKRDIEWKRAAHILNSLALILHVLVVLFTFAVMFFEVIFISRS